MTNEQRSLPLPPCSWILAEAEVDSFYVARVGRVVSAFAALSQRNGRSIGSSPAGSSEGQ